MGIKDANLDIMRSQTDGQQIRIIREFSLFLHLRDSASRKYMLVASTNLDCQINWRTLMW